MIAELLRQATFETVKRLRSTPRAAGAGGGAAYLTFETVKRLQSWVNIPQQGEGVMPLPPPPRLLFLHLL